MLTKCKVVKILKIGKIQTIITLFALCIIFQFFLFWGINSLFVFLTHSYNHMVPAVYYF